MNTMTHQQATLQNIQLPSIGLWIPGQEAPSFSSSELSMKALERVRESMFIVADASGRVGIGFGGQFQSQEALNSTPSYNCLGILPPLYPEWLGDRAFTETHKVRFPYVTGAMARGIASTAIVIAMGKAGMLGFFGSAGLPLPTVAAALDEMRQALGDAHPWGCNLIHSPNQSGLEEGMVDLLLEKDVRRISASAFMGLTPSVVRFAFSGVHLDPEGQIQRRYVFAKVSRPETARHFMAPPPAGMLDALVLKGQLTNDEAKLARNLAVAEDIIVESDSGGHTDNQILTAVFPTILQLRDRIRKDYKLERPCRIGAAGGLGSPTAIAGAFSLGAAFVLTGSVNQACIESGVSDDVKDMLATAQLGDVAMCPCADMFELGVKVQVLKRGTMFSVRATQLYELYRRYDSLDDIPGNVRQRLEKQLFHRPIAQVWADTADFFAQRDPKELAKAQKDPKHQMALVFRWYLGMSSRWPIVGEAKRRIDYQVWCGPAMGAFNSWTAGSFLETAQSRTVVQVAKNLLEGGAVVTRAQQLRSYGVPIPSESFLYRPRMLA
jgi:trans-AT polyketide synthase, acyltransferase and oxidoreductase domains